jgi:RNA 2',3'-cyclic 3'-phosphodiesterase
MGADALGETSLARVRAFFGLPLPDQHRAALRRFLEDCAVRAHEFRWTPAANLHLTIRFLGHVEVSLAEGIADRLVQAGLEGFDITLGDLGTFRRGRLARVVWMGVREGAQEIAEMAAQAEAESVRAGLVAESRPFNAHLTLARARPRDGAALPDLPAPPQLPRWRAGELVLYRSKLGRAGSVYEPLRRISLR